MRVVMVGMDRIDGMNLVRAILVNAIVAVVVAFHRRTTQVE